jgi:hypothetical protein
MVKVTGKRKRFRMTLPVFDEIADEVYHRVQRRTNRIVARPGQEMVGIENGRGEGDRLGGVVGVASSE